MPERHAQIAEHRSYRYGFISAPKDVIASPIVGWRSVRLLGRTFWHHPETRVDVYSPAPGVATVLFGEAFSTTDESVHATLDRLLASSEDSRPLDTLGGRWALFAITPESARVYNDAMGGRSVYWRADGVVTSHAALFEESFGVPPNDEVGRFMQGALYNGRKQTKYLPGDLTRYAGVYALIPNNFVDLATGTTARYWPMGTIEPTTLTDLHDEIDRNLLALASHITGSGYQAVLGATGGADTRLVMAGLIRADIPFETFTSGWETLKEAERSTILKLTKAGGFPHVIIPEQTRGEYVRVALRSSSGVGGTSATVEWFARAYPNTNALFVIGHGGEILRDEKAPLASFTADAWADTYARVKDGINVTPAETEFVRCAFEGFFERGNVAQAEGLGVPPEELYYWEHRMAMWGGGNVANAFDVGMNTIQGYNSRKLYATALGVQSKPGLRSRRMFHQGTARLAPSIDLFPVAAEQPK